ncbi:FRAS1-related extracellular matrix protein 1-like [Panulirus ornatus]|uniref:FRAS1-related extracellular matrix protein 1-like n=1 Tax=Panulirus ornatus TaxID=150431 RepID=UPI003A862246
MPRRPSSSDCGDGREVRHGNVCYLLVPYPQVTWSTASHICADMEGDLATVSSKGLARWFGAGLRNLPDYASGTLFWVGGTLRPYAHTWTWTDGSTLNVSGKPSSWLAKIPISLYF